MKVTQKNVGLVLQKIYDSEIHLQMGWLWDGGVEYRLKINTPYIWDNIPNEDVIVGGSDNIAQSVQWIAEEICEMYPGSSFAKWFTKKWYQFWI